MPSAKLLSTPGIFLGEEKVEVPRGKTSALLYYLAYQHDWVSREDILYLFWPDTEELKARNNLRQLLSAVRKLPFTDNLETNDQHLRWRIASDAQVFKEAVEQKQWPEAVETYHGPLLDNLQAHTFPEFESWLELERAELLRVFKDAALHLSQDFMNSERYKEAAEVLGKILKQDPFDEISFRTYLKAIFLSEGRYKAKRELESYRQTLVRELGAEPEAATLNLLEDLESLAQEGEPGAQSVAISIKTLEAKPLHNLAFKLTPFVGRVKEKAELAQHLATPTCRLLTLLGAGGMGKTRLALAVAEDHLGSFEHGVWFVAFDALKNSDAMPYAIAEALNFRFYGQDDPKKQLLNYLSHKDMLLILDNLEHLLAGVPLITELLESSPKLKILATSRELLNLQAEHVFEVGGLNLERQDEMSDAHRLFVQAARKRRKNLTLNEEDTLAITKICTLIEGMPLAIELAASWLSVLTPEDIANELEQGMTILEGQTRDTPARHQSVRAVFTYSWNLLSERERSILAKLAVFRGGFTRDAAKRVTGATLPILASLVNKSFLRVLPNGRYDRHPLVFEFCLEKLEKLDDAQSVYEQHAEFFLELAEEARPHLEGKEQAQWFMRLEADHENLLTVLDWSLEKGKIETGLSLAVAIGVFWSLRGHYQLGRTRFRQLLEQPLANKYPRLRIEALVHNGDFARYQSDYEEAEKLYKEGLTIAQKIGHKRMLTRSATGLGWIAQIQGDYKEAEKLFIESLELSKEIDYRQGIATSFVNLGSLAVKQSNYSKAETLYKESLAINREMGDKKEIAVSLASLGHVADYQSNYNEAKRYYEASLILSRELGDKQAIGSATNDLGLIHNYQGRYSEAEKLYKESLTISKELGDQLGVAQSLGNLGHILRNQGKYSEAKKTVEESLHLLRNLGDQQGIEIDPLMWTVR